LAGRRVQPRRPAAADEHAARFRLLHRQLFARGIDEMRQERFGGFGDADLNRHGVDGEADAQAFEQRPGGRARRDDDAAGVARSAPPRDAIAVAFAFDRGGAGAGDDARAQRRRRAGEGGGDVERVGLALDRAKGRPVRAGGEIGRAVGKVGGVDQFGFQPGLALDRDLGADLAHFLRRLADEHSAAEAHLKIGVEFGLQPAPHRQRRAQQPHRRHEQAAPCLSLQGEGFVGDLGVEAARVRPGGKLVDLARFEQRHLDAVAREIIGRRTARQPAADDDHAHSQPRLPIQKWALCSHLFA
jgi:hypothetical protein